MAAVQTELDIMEDDHDDDSPLLPTTNDYQRVHHNSSSKRKYCNLFQEIYSSTLKSIKSIFIKEKLFATRSISTSIEPKGKYPTNKISNQKYSLFTFLPKVLFEQFKVFLNLYFLVVACTQLIPQLRTGYWYTYWGPLMSVVTVTILRELYDDIKRYHRDKVINSQKYTKLTKQGPITVKSESIHVSDLILVDKDQRIPADMVLLKTSSNISGGTCYIRTDQLDGETDWKLKHSLSVFQQLKLNEDILSVSFEVIVEQPQKDLYSFAGNLKYRSPITNELNEEPLSVLNTTWSNSVLATGSIVGMVIYTGKDTRAILHTSSPRVKSGQADNEINNLTKLLFLIMIIMAVVMLSLKGFSGLWYVFLLRYIILLSYIIPISLRVNLDMAKLVYGWIIQHDANIKNTIVRNSTIPEELGRIEYMLTDKTGTLTNNEMIFKKLHIGSTCFSAENSNEIMNSIHNYYTNSSSNMSNDESLVKCVLALSLCHNVTPVSENVNNVKDSSDDCEDKTLFNEAYQTTGMTYQASSPDEIALVKWAALVDLALIERDHSSLCIQLPDDSSLEYDILHLFPFNSERKRMGIIVKNRSTNLISFYMKGADVVMKHIVQYSDWLDDECGNLSREGLRTLVFGKKDLTENEFYNFDHRYKQAQMSLCDRDAATVAVLDSIENNLELLCITGVEDTLQVDVRPTLELLKNAGIKIWMLTGDKLETASSIALSSHLVDRNQKLFIFKEVSTRAETHAELNQLRKHNETSLILSGNSLELCLEHYEFEFSELICQFPVVICCRSSPMQKANVVKLLKRVTKKSICAIGDGGNDVSMIQAADVGVGVVGKEGMQASLAADFSITQFCHISRLLMWHGRNCYKRTAALSQFVIHRGLIITAMQVVFSAVFYFVALPLYEGILMIGYATVYTMAPVFSLIVDEDVSSDVAMLYPELYKDLLKGRNISLKTFLIWFLISTYQGGVMMLFGFILFDSEIIHVVSITFTSLIITELLMVFLTIRTCHLYMIIAEIFSIGVYVLSLVLLKSHFDSAFLLTFNFIWKTLLITSLSCVPLVIIKIGYKRCAPPGYAKLLKQNSVFRNCCKINCS